MYNIGLSSLCLAKPHSYSTIMCVRLEEQKGFEWVDSSGYRRKNAWCPSNPVIDTQLQSWVLCMWEKGAFLTDIVIQEKGKQILCAYKFSHESHEHYNILFTNGWLHPFKECHGFKCYRSFGKFRCARHRFLHLDFALLHCEVFHSIEKYSNLN